MSETNSIKDEKIITLSNLSVFLTNMEDVIDQKIIVKVSSDSISYIPLESGV